MDLDFGRAFSEIEMGSGYGLNDRSHDGRPVQVLPCFLPRARRGNGQPLIQMCGQPQRSGVQAWLDLQEGSPFFDLV
jgi:hypothetical protein